METKRVKMINVHQLIIPLLEIKPREMTRNRQRKIKLFPVQVQVQVQVRVRVRVQVMISLKMFLSIALTSIAKILSRGGAPFLQPSHPEGRA